MHRVLIAHPMRQYALEFAAAMHEAGWFQSFLTMLPDEESVGWLPAPVRRRLPTALARNPLSRLPRSMVRILNGPLLLAKASQKAGRLGPGLELMAWTIFDRWVARAVRKSRPSVVVGYEMCCLETLRAAREVGAAGILDAAAFEYRHQDNQLGLDRKRLPAAEIELRRRKDAEIALADRIVCCSAAARDSYVRAGADSCKVVANPLGCDTRLFAPSGPDRRSGPVKFVFVGTASHRKGADSLHQAFASLIEAHPDAQLHVAGDQRIAGEFFSAPNQNLIFHGKLGQADLAALCWRMDCLVLPSLLDSFGMVVVEALAAGLPAIVTSAVGAAEAIEPGVNGWVIEPRSVPDLARQMREVSADIVHLRAMRADCIASAVDYDWRSYRARAIEIVGSLSPGAR